MKVFGQNKYKAIVLYVLLVATRLFFAQTRANSAFNFLNIPVSPKMSALGSNVVSIKDNDLSLVHQNAALLDSALNNHLSLNYNNYLTDINQAYVAYAKQIKQLGMFYTSLQFLDYGKFLETDAAGNIIGSFGAQDYSLNIGYAKKIDSTFSVGTSLKTIISSLYGATAIASAVDLGGLYYNKQKNFNVGISIRNIGLQLKKYSPTDTTSKLPFDISLGITKKLQHAPFRFSITASHLEKWSLIYEDPLRPSAVIDPLTNETQSKSKLNQFADNLFRHFSAGLELLLTKNFNFRLGYNHLQRRELRPTEVGGLTGFSFGLGLKISKFQLSLARQVYQIGQPATSLSLNLNLSEFYTKKQ